MGDMSLRKDGAKLVLEVQDKAGCHLVPIPVGVHHFGRDLTSLMPNEVMLNSPKVSRRHAVLILEKDRIWIIDTQSMHGTWVGQKKLRHYEVTKWPEGVVATFGSDPDGPSDHKVE